MGIFKEYTLNKEYWSFRVHQDPERFQVLRGQRYRSQFEDVHPDQGHRRSAKAAERDPPALQTKTCRAESMVVCLTWKAFLMQNKGNRYPGMEGKIKAMISKLWDLSQLHQTQ